MGPSAKTHSWAYFYFLGGLFTYLNQLPRQGSTYFTRPPQFSIWPEILLISKSQESPPLSALGDKVCVPCAPTEVTGSSGSTDLSSPVSSAFPKSLYSRDQRSNILWALGELFLPNPSALSSAHPLPRIANSSSLLSCFSKDFTAGKQRLEIFQKLGYSCLQEPI